MSSAGFLFIIYTLVPTSIGLVGLDALRRVDYTRRTRAPKEFSVTQRSAYTHLTMRDTEAYIQIKEALEDRINNSRLSGGRCSEKRSVVDSREIRNTSPLISL